MANVLHWVGIVIGFSVIAGGIHFFLRGLSGKPSDPSARGPGSAGAEKPELGLAASHLAILGPGNLDLAMANILHWIGVGLGLLVLAVGIGVSSGA